MGRTSKNIKLRIPEKPRKIKGFRTGSYRVATTISSQSRYNHFDTTPNVPGNGPDFFILHDAAPIVKGEPHLSRFAVRNGYFSAESGLFALRRKRAHAIIFHYYGTQAPFCKA